MLFQICRDNKIIAIFPLFQSLKQSVTDFESNEMNDFRKQVQNIMKTCNENSKNELQEISQGT